MRRTMTMLAAGALALGAGGMLAACSSDDAAEEAIEQGTGGEVDINSDEGSFTVEGEDGSISGGTCEELPDDFPSDVPTPDADPVACGSSSGQSQGDTWSITYSNDDANAVVEDYRGTLEDAGYTVEGEFSAGGSDAGFASYSATNDAYSVTVTSAGAGDDGVINVTVVSA